MKPIIKEQLDYLIYKWRETKTAPGCLPIYGFSIYSCMPLTFCKRDLQTLKVSCEVIFPHMGFYKELLNFTPKEWKEELDNNFIIALEQYTAKWFTQDITEAINGVWFAHDPFFVTPWSDPSFYGVSKELILFLETINTKEEELLIPEKSINLFNF